jgi:DNA-binding PadR family transcriptional regulator
MRDMMYNCGYFRAVAGRWWTGGNSAARCPGGSDAMQPAHPHNWDADPLDQLEQLCGHRWDSHLLLQLARSQPLRRAELAARITQAAGRRISDGQLDRTIRRLGSQQLVKWSLDQGHKIYRLTARGHEHADRIRWLVQLLDPPDAHPQPATPATSYASQSGASAPGGIHDRTAFADEWSSELRSTGTVPLSRQERDRMFTELTDALHNAMATDAPEPAARHVGTELVTAGFTTPEALGRTISLVSSRLPDQGTTAVTSGRVTALVEHLAAGFVQALTGQILAAQDSVRAAGLHAYTRAQQPRSSTAASSHRRPARGPSHKTRSP